MIQFPHALPSSWTPYSRGYAMVKNPQKLPCEASCLIRGNLENLSWNVFCWKFSTSPSFLQQSEIQPLTFHNWKTVLIKSYLSSLISGSNQSSSSSFLHSTSFRPLVVLLVLLCSPVCPSLPSVHQWLPEWHNLSPCDSHDFPANTC